MPDPTSADESRNGPNGARPTSAQLTDRSAADPHAGRPTGESPSRAGAPAGLGDADAGRADPVRAGARDAAAGAGGVRRRRSTDGNGLGEFLRARRARVQPTDLGLPAGLGPRRTPGLRREELAAVAGVSVDYYIRLEQGKETRPSDAVVNALGRALRLDAEEYTHLRALAEWAARGATTPSTAPARTVRPALRQLLETVLPNPAYVVTRTNDMLAANRPGLRLMAGLGDWPTARRNTVRYVFLHPTARTLFPYWAKVATETVAHLRTVAGSYPDAPDLAALVGELVVKSEEFATMWRRYDVRVKGDGRKEFDHPEVGRFGLDFEVLTPAHADGQRLIVYQAKPGTADHDAMLLLGMAQDEPA